MMPVDYAVLVGSIVTLIFMIMIAAVAIWDMRLIFDRRLFRFRLRTLLLVAASIQVCLAFGMWWRELGGDVVAGFALVGVGAFVAWGFWWVLDDVFGASPVRRFKSQIHPNRIAEPPKPTGVEPPPRQEP